MLNSIGFNPMPNISLGDMENIFDIENELEVISDVGEESKQPSASKDDIIKEFMLEQSLDCINVDTTGCVNSTEVIDVKLDKTTQGKEDIQLDDLAKQREELKRQREEFERQKKAELEERDRLENERIAKIKKEAEEKARKQAEELIKQKEEEIRQERARIEQEKIRQEQERIKQEKEKIAQEKERIRQEKIKQEKEREVQEEKIRQEKLRQEQKRKEQERIKQEHDRKIKEEALRRLLEEKRKREKEQQVKLQSQKPSKPRQQIDTSIYDGLDADALYNEVRKFLKAHNIEKKIVDIKILESRFGKNNIKKLVVKSYLISIGKGVTIGK